MTRTTLAAILLVALCGTCAAQIELGIGYSRLDLNGADKNFNGADGWGMDLRLIGPMLGPALSQLRLGTDLGFRTYDISGQSTGATPERSELTLYTGELRASWRQEFGTLFVEPSIGAGLFYGTYTAVDKINLGNAFEDSSWGWSLRPGITIGTHVGPITAGVEASYRFGHLGIENDKGGDVHEFYAGVFAGISF